MLDKGRIDSRWLFGAGALAGLLASWLYREARVRRQFVLLAEETAAVGRTEPFSLGMLFEILRQDPHFREYMENVAATAAPAENPYGLTALWRDGGPIAQATLIILLIMSAVSWYIIFSKLWDQRRLRKGAKVVEKQFWSSGSLKEAVDRLPKDSDFRAVAEDGLRASAHHG